ncbi:MAG: LysM peptidoglycan-binding domain-containing protein [Chloroflexi bacterium]|nr:LysM peptidoglycan-binding domain-containing protein [Chloroflexota bacterium]
MPVHREANWLVTIATLSAVILLAGCGSLVTPTPDGGTPAPNLPFASATPAVGVTATDPIVLPPEASATPTITPEPTIHIVQSNDTLYSIAFDYGVDPDLLQSVNGIEDPTLLQIGQELIIPRAQPETESSAESLLPTPTPLPLEVQGVAFYETPVGSLWCLGEVVNTTDTLLTNAQVRASLFDSAGEQMIEKDAFVAAELIAPGERSPFGILFTAPPTGWAASQVELIRAEAAGELAGLFTPVAITDANGQAQDSQFEVRGSVQNTSEDRGAGSVTVIATTYDQGGLVTGFRLSEVSLENTLAPGASASFRLLFTVHGDAPADFSITALGRSAQ